MLRTGQLGSTGEQVSEIVDLHAFRSGDEFLGAHALDETVTDFLGHFDEHIAFDLGIDEFPERCTVLEGQGFEEPRHLGRMQAVHHDAGRAHATAVELVSKQRQADLGVLSRLHGGGVEQLSPD